MQAIKSLKYLIALAALAGSAHAASIPITNHSFETVDGNGLENPHVMGAWDDNVVGWNQIGGPFTSGTYSPSTPGNTSGLDVFSVDVPDGVNTAWMSVGALSQNVGHGIGVNEFFTLQVDVGNRLNKALPNYALQLRTDNGATPSRATNQLLLPTATM